MRIEFKPFGCGLILAIMFLGFGTVAVIGGIDATVNRWVATGRGSPKYGIPSRGGGTYDRTRLYGPGVIIGGVCVGIAGILVIPSLMMMEMNRRGRVSPLWPKVVFIWRLVILGAIVGFGCSIVAGLLGPLL